MQILLSFVGSHDPLNEDGSDGPLLSLLHSMSFKHIYFFYNADQFLKRASDCKREIDRRGGQGEIHYIETKIPDPTDYKILFQLMNDSCRKIINEHQNQKVEFFISTTSGTPQMATVWILLNKSGLMPGKLLQILDAKFFENKTARVREINLDIDDFPQLQSPPEIKRKLSIYKTKSDYLEEQLELKTVRLIGKAKPFIDVINLAIKFAKYKETVTLFGESGTGKEEFAKLIHEKSRLDGPFITVNCAGFSENLLESELFGYVKGSFTGASSDRNGIVMEANDGTLFFDEIGELPLGLQAKLLRFLNDGSFRPVGDTKEKHSNARVITATNSNLNKMVKNSEFREDLFHRINMAVIELPPLNKRKEDIELLAGYFLDEFNRKYKESKKIELAALHLLMNFDWQNGNIRALRNLIGKLFMKVDTNITPEDIRKELAGIDIVKQELIIKISEDGIKLKDILQNIEQQFIFKALEITGGNKLQAAKLVGYSRIDHKTK